jgi:hypothetical protein
MMIETMIATMLGWFLNQPSCLTPGVAFNAPTTLERQP